MVTVKKLGSGSSTFRWTLRSVARCYYSLRMRPWIMADGEAAAPAVALAEAKAAMRSGVYSVSIYCCHYLPDGRQTIPRRAIHSSWFRVHGEIFDYEPTTEESDCVPSDTPWGLATIDCGP